MEYCAWLGQSKSQYPGSLLLNNDKFQYSFKVRKNLWRPRVKLLTEDEYREQSNIETRKALEELRRYLDSSDYGLVEKGSEKTL